MKRVSVSQKRPIWGALAAVCAVMFLLILITAGSLKAPEPTPIALLPSPRPGLPTPTIDPNSPLPEVYVVTSIDDSIVLYDPHTQTVLSDFGTGDDFFVRDEFLIIVATDHIRAINLRTGILLWQNNMEPNYTSQGRIAVVIREQTLLVAEYIALAPLDVQLQFTSYALQTGEQVVQQRLSIDQLVQVVIHPQADQPIVLYTSETILIYDLEQDHILLTRTIVPSIMTILPRPDQTGWYLLDSTWHLRELTFDRIEQALSMNTRPFPSEQFQADSRLVQAQIEPSQRRLYVLATRLPENSPITLVNYHLNTTISHQVILPYMAQIQVDEQAGGVWLNDTEDKYWNGLSSDYVYVQYDFTPYRYRFTHKFISVPPRQPQQTPELITLAEPQTTVLQTKTNDLAEPLAWFWSSLERPTWRVLQTNGELKTVAEGANTGFARRDAPPILVLAEPNAPLYFPETDTKLELELDYLPVDFEWYSNEGRVTFSVDQTRVALITSGGDVRLNDQILTLQQVVLINLATGAVQVYALEDAAEQSWQLIGWGASGIYFLYEETSVWRLDLETAKYEQVFELEPNRTMELDRIAFDPQRERLAFVQAERTLTIRDLQANQVLYQGIFDSINQLRYMPEQGTLIWLTETKTKQIVYSLAPQLNRPQQLLNQPIYQNPSNMYGVGVIDQVGARLIFRGARLPHIDVNEYHVLDLQTNVQTRFLTSLHIQTATSTGYVGTISPASAEAAYVRVPYGQTESDVVLYRPTIVNPRVIALIR